MKLLCSLLVGWERERVVRKGTCKGRGEKMKEKQGRRGERESCGITFCLWDHTVLFDRRNPGLWGCPIHLIINTFGLCIPNGERLYYFEKNSFVFVFIGNKKTHHIFLLLGNLGTIIPGLYSLLYIFTGLFFLCWVFIIALSLLGHDVFEVRSNREQGAALAAWLRPWPWRSQLTSPVSLFLCLKCGDWIVCDLMSLPALWCSVRKRKEFTNYG